MIDQSITWDSIYRAIRSEQNGREVYQGVVTGRDTDRSCVWVAELSSDPIEVTGHGVDLTYFEAGNRKVARVGPSIPEIGDLVLLARTASDQFKCVGVLQQSAKWSAKPAIGSAFSAVPAASYTATIGDGTTTVFTVTHALNTIDTLVLVREAAGDQSFVYPEIRTVNVNSIQVVFDVAPTTNQYRILVTGGTFGTSPVSGAAGGDLSGSYPNPQIASGVIVDADVAAAAAIQPTKVAPALYARVIGNAAGDHSMSSTTPLILSAYSITLTCRGNPMQITLSCSFAAAAGIRCNVALYMDNAQIEGASYQFPTPITAFVTQAGPTVTWTLTPSSASHTFQVAFWSNTAGQPVYIMNTPGTYPCFVVQELIH